MFLVSTTLILMHVFVDMNRHHYSVFVHGDKLVLLLRREAEDASDMEVFKPAEWRWKIPEINERDQWHHYAISMNFPHVSIYNVNFLT